MNKIYKSTLLKLSTLSPIFGRRLLDEALCKIDRTPDNVAATDMITILKKELNPLLFKKEMSKTGMLNAGAGLIITDRHDKITYLNPIAKSLLETLKKERRGDDFHLLCEAGFCLSLKETSRVRVIGARLGNTIYNSSIAPIFDENQVIVGTVSIVLDVTLYDELENEALEYVKKLKAEIQNRLEAEHRLIENQAAMVRSSKLASLGEMGAGIAHEINNPLSVIKLSCELIDEQIRCGEVDIESIGDLIRSSNNAIGKISEIITSMKNLARRSEDLPVSSVSASEILDGVISLYQARFDQKGVAFSIIGKEEFGKAHVLCRASEIGQVLVDLFNNALDALADLDEKWVKVKLEKENEMFKFSVIDSGAGIPKEIRQEIFEPFFTTKGVGEGTGLGLSISSKIIEANKGKLLLDEKYSYTKFDIYLPLASTDQ